LFYKTATQTNRPVLQLFAVYWRYRRKESHLFADDWRPFLHRLWRTTNGCSADDRTACAVH